MTEKQDLKSMATKIMQNIEISQEKGSFNENQYLQIMNILMKIYNFEQTNTIISSHSLYRSWYSWYNLGE